MSEKSKVIATVCSILTGGDVPSASSYLRLEYPFSSQPAVQRKYTAKEALSVFLRDGFVDRYSADRLVFPGTLRVISLLLPDEFPYHKNWKMSETHFGVWELCPTVDHIVPVARGGADVQDNWLTTSMVRNSAKGNWTIEELGWSIKSAGSLSDWDGLLSWFRSRVVESPKLLEDKIVSTWHKASSVLAVV